MRGTGGSLGMRYVTGPGGSRPVVRVGPRLMKKTTGDPWRESRPAANGIEPSDARSDDSGGSERAPPTPGDGKDVAGVERGTDRRGDWSTNPEIGE
ncbi:hypothetical protein GCM10010421_56660 [Streptomyces glaucus]|uniref:Uncharacterized protein n=1 Tax=Streptomyces glaucus TaxID=284029 RepID=A0ABN3KGA6_9ACTN